MSTTTSDSLHPTYHIQHPIHHFREDYTGPETEIAKLMLKEEIGWIPTKALGPQGYYSLEEEADPKAPLNLK
jgi:hypothetical protein